MCIFFSPWVVKNKIPLLTGRKHKQQHLYMQRVYGLWVSSSPAAVKHLKRGAWLHHPCLTWSAVNNHAGELGSMASFTSSCNKNIVCIAVYIGSSIASQVVAWGGLADGGKVTQLDGQWNVTNPHRFTLGDFRVSEEISCFILCQASLQTWTEWVFLGYQINLPAVISHPEKWEQFCTDLADVLTMAQENSSSCSNRI